MTINRIQRIILLLVLAMIIGMWVYPPWIHHMRSAAHPPGYIRHSHGYYFVFDTVQGEDDEYRGGMILRIDFVRLVVQSMVVSVIAAAAFVGFASRRSEPAAPHQSQNDSIIPKQTIPNQSAPVSDEKPQHACEGTGTRSEMLISDSEGLENLRKENVGDWQLFKARRNEAGKNILVLQAPTGKLAFTDDPSAMLLSPLDDFTDEEGGKTVLEMAKLLRKRQEHHRQPFGVAGGSFAG